MDAGVGLDPFTTIFTLGLVYSVMPLAVWGVLVGRQEPLGTALWCSGATLSGLSYLLIGLRPSLPAVLSIEVASAIGYAGVAMRWAALRRQRDLAVPTIVVVAATLAAALAYVHAATLGAAPRIVAGLTLQALANALVAFEAWCLARQTGSGSARLISITSLLLTLALINRALWVQLGFGTAVQGEMLPDVAIVLVAGMLAVLGGNIGYVGVAMEHLQRGESARAAEAAAANARRDEAERQAAELKQLSEERQELLRVIAHEVRQPLHNAQAVLQGVEDALRADTPEGDSPRRRVDRARSVLRQITGGLDNVLASSTLLVGQRPTPLRDTDLGMLLELCLGDLPPAGLTRVRVTRDTDVRTAALDVGLMRLALRNLLNNALAYSVAGSMVTLRVADSDDPLAVVFEVADAGPGIAPELLGTVFERGTRGRHDLPGQGLGLYIVRLAMRLQGGAVDVRSSPVGTVFTLSVPQGLEPG